MSKIATDIYDELRNLFPLYYIKKEHYVNFKNNKLFFDYYIKSIGVLVEVQGQQHVKYVEFFHKNVYNFISQKNRDNLKIEYVETQDALCLVRFYFDEKIDKDIILYKIGRALEETFYE